MHVLHRYAMAIMATSVVASESGSAHAAEPLAPTAEQAWNRLYVGRLGGQPVVALFSQSGADLSQWDGKYYYRRHTSEIELVPEGPGHLWFECARCDPPRGVWQVEITPNAVNGSWRATVDAATSKPIALKRYEPGSRMSSGFNEADDMFYSMLAEDQRRNIAAAAAREGVRWRSLRLSHSGQRGKYNGYVATVQLTSAPNAIAMTRINRRLLAGYDEIVGATRHELERQGVDADFSSVVDEDVTDVLFANARLFAVGRRDDISGGVHPSNGFSTWTFDLQTGELIEWGKLLRLADTLPGKYGDFSRQGPLDLSRQDVLAAYVLRKALTDEESCTFAAARYYFCEDSTCAQVDSAENLPWHLWPTPGGLAVAPDVYSEAERGCRGEPVIIPWADVRKIQIGRRALP